MHEPTAGGDLIIDPAARIDCQTGRKIQATPAIIGAPGHIRANTVIYTNVTIGDGLQTGHGVVIREENTIGRNCNIWNNSTVDYGCVIGDNVKIHCNCYIAQYTTIEDGVFMAPGVTIANDPHPVCTLCMRGPTIKRGARIGVNVTILPNVTIGEYALVAAGSVVTKDVPPRMLVRGNPARVVKSIYELECRCRKKDKAYQTEQDR